MKLRLSILSCLFVLLAASANGQNSLDVDIRNLQKQIQMWEAIVRENANAPDKPINVSRLTSKQRELLEAVTKRMAQLRSAGDASSQRLRELTLIHDGLLTTPASTPQASQLPVAGVGPRAVSTIRSGNGSERVMLAPAVSPLTKIMSSPIMLDTIRVGDSLIKGTSIANINEVVVEIRSAGSIANVSSTVSARYSHTELRRAQSVQVYRVRRQPAAGNSGDVWHFTIRLSEPFAANQEVRAMASGSNSAATPWLKVGGGTVAEPALAANRSAGPLSSQPLTVTKVDRLSQERTSRIQTQRVTERPELNDPCAGDPSLRNIYVDWETKNISPSRLKHSGNYCVIVSNANTILYSYAVRVESEEVQGNPLDLLNTAIASLKNIGDSSTGTPAPAKTPDATGAEFINRRPAHTCELPPLVEQVKRDASDLQQAFAALLPEETGGKIPSIKLETTRKAWDPIPEKFNSFAASSEALRLKLSTAAGVADCSADQIKAATDIIGNYYKVRVQYESLRSGVNSPPVVKVRADELDAADKIKVTVTELYGGRQSAAENLTLNVSPGYSQISASAGFLVTQLPARSYSSRTAPNPANLTTTQNVLGVDYAAGMRPALTALINYNLPFIRQNRFGLALSAGPVYDISGGKADTSKFGFFGGVSARFSQWLYVTPGFHVGEFADFPEGFTRNGQVIPDNTGTPVPVKRYTTRFALAVTFKVKDLGSSSAEAPANH